MVQSLLVTVLVVLWVENWRIRILAPEYVKLLE